MVEKTAEIKKMPHNLLFRPAKDRPSFLMPDDEWTYLKQDIDSILKPFYLPLVFHTLGSLFCGAAISLGAGLLIEGLQWTPDNALTAKSMICLTATIALLAIGIIAFFAAWWNKAVTRRGVTDVRRSMARIEKIYSFSEEETNQPD